GKRVQEVVVIDNLTLNAFDDRAATNTAALYPGSIIKVKDFAEQNDLSGIGGIKRNPIEVSSDLGDIRLVDDPSQRGNIDAAIKEMENANPTFAANVKSESTRAYSLEQSMWHVGVDAKYLGNSVKGRFDFEQTVEKHSFVVKFYQVYHTASIANPGTVADLFHTDNHPDELQQILNNSGPLGLITEVAYGRMLIGIFTYEGSSYSSSTEIETQFNKGLLSVDGELDQESKGFFENSTFKVAILGGDAQEAANVAGSGLGMESIQAAYKWMRDGGSDPSLGVPIQYKIRQLADPSFPLLAISGAVDYDVPDCSSLPNKLSIKSITITSLPPQDEDDKKWDHAQVLDVHKDPDIYLIFQKYKDNDWQWLAGFEDKKIDNLKSSDLPTTIDVNIPVEEEDFRITYNVQFYDDDDNVLDLLEELGSTYDLVGNINFNF
ncbi:MAG: thiol-activated cytolysin family protein, partial [Bacteroidota bacterium]